MSQNDESEPAVSHVADVPVCRGCGLMGEVHDHDGLCDDCWNRRERRAGGGPLRVVTRSWTYHETPLCPAVRNASEWRYWRDEDCMYADMAGDMDRCIRCYSHRTFGFDEYAGAEDRQAVIGHA